MCMCGGNRIMGIIFFFEFVLFVSFKKINNIFNIIFYSEMCLC